VVDTSIGGVLVVREVEHLVTERGRPRVIVSDNELSKKAMAAKKHVRGGSQSKQFELRLHDIRENNAPAR
jgi:hypothetical protein